VPTNKEEHEHSFSLLYMLPVSSLPVPSYICVTRQLSEQMISGLFLVN